MKNEPCSARILKPLLLLKEKRSKQKMRVYAPLQLHDLVLQGGNFFENPRKLLSAPTNKKNPQLEHSIFFPKFYDSNPKTVKLLELVIEKYKPTTIVETGIANGVSTRAILEALKINKLTNSHLYSFDINPQVVTEDLKINKQFTFKHVCKQNLQELFQDVPKIDLFYHDSDHTYRNQLTEYKIAWNKMSDGGILMSDDINWSNAFLDFCFFVNRKPKILVDTEKFCGLIYK